MVNKIRGFGWKYNVIFWLVFLAFLAFNFSREFIGVSYIEWHLFLHAGIVFFCFAILLFSLKLNPSASKYIFMGSFLWIIIESVLFLSHIFVAYFWIESNIIVWFISIVGIFMFIEGFKEAVE